MTGQLAVTRRSNDFARVYDLAERVLPAAVLAAPTPTESDARKELLVLAARFLGVGTLGDLADYYRHDIPSCRPLVAELVEEGRLVAAEVEGWKQPAYVHPAGDACRAASTDGRCSARSTRWCGTASAPSGCSGSTTASRSTSRLPSGCTATTSFRSCSASGSSGRIDLKADRATGTLRVQAAHGEPGIDVGEVAVELAAELELMAGWLGLEHVAVGERGDLAPALAGVAGS